jgi:poly [ADP-ribose] polymerase 2/3/4
LWQYQKKFKDKSGLAWANRGDDPKKGKYAYVERSSEPDTDDEEQTAANL